MDEFTRAVLKKWGMENIIPLFEEQEIDEEALYSLTPEFVQTLLPKVGQQVKFLKRLAELKTSSDSKLETSVYQDGKCAISSFCSSSSTIHLSGSPPALCSTPSTSSIDSNVTLSDDLEEASIPTPAEVAITCIGDVEMASDIPRSCVTTPTNLKEMLQNTANGRIIMAAYKTGGLDEHHRRMLVNIVIGDRLQGNKLTHDDLKALSAQIVEQFPKEREECYYVPPVHNGKIQKIAKGKLVDKVRNTLRQMRKCGAILPKKKQQTNPEKYEASKANPDVTESVLWLKHCTEPWPAVLVEWEKTHSHRMEELKLRNSKKVADYFESYPALKQPLGYLLFEIDFTQIFPGKERALYGEWETFCTAVISLLEKKTSKDAKVKELLTSANNNARQEEISVRILFTLVSLFRVTPTIKQKSGIWRPSRIECQESFVTMVKVPGDVKPAIERRKNKAALLELPVQPCIYLVGESESSVESSYIAVDNVLYKLESPLCALDQCFKSFWALNAEYPAESEHIWLLIQKKLFQISTKNDKILTSVNSVLADLTQ